MRVVLDTNVLISAYATPLGVSGQIYNAWTRGEFTLVTSPYIFSEVGRVSLRLGFTRERIGGVLTELYRLTEVVEPFSIFIDGIDADDMPIVGTALAGNAEYIVTGDRRLLALRRYETIKLIAPRAFLAVM